MELILIHGLTGILTHKEIKEFKEFLDFLNYYEDLARWMIDDGCDDLCKFFMDEESCESMDED